MPAGRTYEALRARIEDVPVINAHEHFDGPGEQPEHTCAPLVIARDVVAAAQIAGDWLFNNPNEFYRLGFQPVSA